MMASDVPEEFDPREEIVDHVSALRAFAISLSQNSALADDLVQDTIVKAWTNFDKFQPGTNLRAWLFTILRNAYYSHRRKMVREVADPDGVMAMSLAEKPAHDGRLQLRELLVALGKLPEDQREAILLVGASGFTYEEAAEMCDVAVGTIKSRANRARTALAGMLDLTSNDTLDLTDGATLAVLARPEKFRK